MSNGTAFRAFIDAVGLHGQAAATAAGLAASDWFALSLLDRQGPLTPSELSRLTGLTSGATTRMIDRLERTGRVQRRREGTDRRKVLVQRTEQAFAEGEIDTLVDPAREAIGAVLADFSDPEQQILFRFFAQATPAFHAAAQTIRDQQQKPPPPG